MSRRVIIAANSACVCTAGLYLDPSLPPHVLSSKNFSLYARSMESSGCASSACGRVYVKKPMKGTSPLCRASHSIAASCIKSAEYWVRFLYSSPYIGYRMFSSRVTLTVEVSPRALLYLFRKLG